MEHLFNYKLSKKEVIRSLLLFLRRHCLNGRWYYQNSQFLMHELDPYEFGPVPNFQFGDLVVFWSRLVFDCSISWKNEDSLENLSFEKIFEIFTKCIESLDEVIE